MIPNMTIEAIGMMMIETTSRRLLHGLGFSNGWAEFGPKKPPPLVPSCLIATRAATGPTAIDLCSPRSSVVAWTACSKVIGTPVATSSERQHGRQGKQHQRDAPDQVEVEIAQVRSPRRPRITASITPGRTPA